MDDLDGAVLETNVTRLIVLGGRGKFGKTAADALRAMGLHPLVASRRTSADITVDAENQSEVRAVFERGDLVIDTAGAFQNRTTTLIEAAIEIGFDVIDICDDLGYAQKVLALAAPIADAGIRVLSSCSSVSAISAAMIKLSGCNEPIRVSGFLLPATRNTGNPGSALSFFKSVGQPVQTLRDGALITRKGWSEPRSLALEEHTIRGRLFESADAVYLPLAWPTLREVAMYVDTNTFGANNLLRVAAHAPALRRLIERNIQLGTRVSRMLGSTFSALAYEIESSAGETTTLALTSRTNGAIVPIAPVVLAAKQIADDTFEHTGFVPPENQIDADDLVAYLEAVGVKLACWRAKRGPLLP